jgi:hypothetical protein
MFSLTDITQEFKGAETNGTANPYADVHNKLMGKNRTFFATGRKYTASQWLKHCKLMC